MKSKFLKGFVFLFVCLLFTFSCKHDNDGKNGQKEEKKEEKALVLSTFKVGDNAYNKQEKTILVTKSSLKEEDIKDVVFTDESGTEVKNVNWKMNPERLPQIKADSKFKIEVKTPPKGYKAFESEEITPIRELVPPEVTSITVHGVRADVSKQPFTVRIPKPTVATPVPGLPGAPPPEIEVRFNKDVPPASVSYEGLPADSKPLTPEEVAHATIKVAESAGKWKAGEYKLDITFDTPSLSIKGVTVKDQDGDTDISDNSNITLMVVNTKVKIESSDVKVSFDGKYIPKSELDSVVVRYEGLPLENLEVSKPRTFTVKVDAKEKVYKAFEAKVTVTRANKALMLKKISVLTQQINDLSNLAINVGTMQTFIKKGDIKATFDKPDGAGELEVDCDLIGGEKLALKAGVENAIVFKVPPTDDYAEYRNTVKIKHDAEWEKMIELPMPAGGVTWLSGSKDETNKSLNRKIEVAQFPVRFELWKQVIDWAKGDEGKQKGYKNIEVIERLAQNGAIDGQSHPNGTAGMPVCAMSYHAALVWCNAYSEMKGHAPVYYKTAPDKITLTWKTHPEDMFNGKDQHLYDISDQKVEIGATATKEEISALALRDALEQHHPDHYKGDIWSNIRDNYIKAVVLTAKQAKCDDGIENGFRLIDKIEWEFAARLKLEKTKHTTASTFSYGNKTYFFANKDCAAGSDGYGDEGSEIKKVAWFGGNSAIDGVLQTHPIGEKWSTDLGFYDLSGNVASWTSTWSKFNGSEGDGVGDFALYTVGGGFNMGAGRCLVNSFGINANGRFDECGIRLARTLK